MRDRILSQDERKSIFTAALHLIGSGLGGGEAQALLRLLRRDELGLPMEPEQHQAAQGVVGAVAGAGSAKVDDGGLCSPNQLKNWQGRDLAKAAAEARRLMQEIRY